MLTTLILLLLILLLILSVALHVYFLVLRWIGICNERRVSAWVAVYEDTHNPIEVILDLEHNERHWTCPLLPCEIVYHTHKKKKEGE